MIELSRRRIFHARFHNRRRVDNFISDAGLSLCKVIDFNPASTENQLTWRFANCSRTFVSWHFDRLPAAERQSRLIKKFENEFCFLRHQSAGGLGTESFCCVICGFCFSLCEGKIRENRYRSERQDCERGNGYVNTRCSRGRRGRILNYKIIKVASASGMLSSSLVLAL